MRTKFDIDDDYDDDRILRDRGSVKVPMTFMDHELRADLARRYPPRSMMYNLSVTDAFGAPAGHRPGYVFLANDAARDACDAAWEERGRILQNAWRDPLRFQKPPRHDSSPVRAATASHDADAAWEERGRIMREAWRHP